MRLHCVCLHSLIFSMCNMLPPWYLFSTLVDLTRLHRVAPLFLSSLCTTQRFHCVALLCISLCAFFHQLHSSITFGALFLFAPLSNSVCEFLPLLVFFHLILLWWFVYAFLWASMKFFLHFCFYNNTSNSTQIRFLCTFMNICSLFQLLFFVFLFVSLSFFVWFVLMFCVFDM